MHHSVIPEIVIGGEPGLEPVIDEQQRMLAG